MNVTSGSFRLQVTFSLLCRILHSQMQIIIMALEISDHIFFDVLSSCDHYSCQETTWQLGKILSYFTKCSLKLCVRRSNASVSGYCCKINPGTVRR